MKKKIHTKKQLIEALRDLGEKKINQGISYKAIALSIEQRKDEKTLTEWLDFTKDIIDFKENESKV